MEMERLQGAFANAVGRARTTLRSLLRPPSDPDAVILAFLNSARFEQAARESYQPENVPSKFVPKPPKIVCERTLRRQFKTTAEAITAGRYLDGHDSGISNASYPMRDGMQGEVDLVGLDLSECFDHWPSSAELHALIAEYGYHRPVYEDGLRHGGEFPDESYERACVYPHVPGADGRVLVRGGWNGSRRLRRDFDRPDTRWSQRCIFFVRRKKA